MRFITKDPIIKRIQDGYAYEKMMKRAEINAVILSRDEWKELCLAITMWSEDHILLPMDDGTELSVCREGYWCVPK